MGLQRLDPYRLLLDGRITIYLSRELERTLEDGALAQLRAGLTVPGVVGVCAMPDVHTGFGLPIGGVMAVAAEGGAVSPAAVGVDINCGVQLISTDIELGALEKERDRRRFFERCVLPVIPAGEGKRGHLRFPDDPDGRRRYELILIGGVRALAELGYLAAETADRMEEGGAMPGAEPGALTEEAYAIGREQLGSLGSGNHFVELQAVDEVFDPDLAEAWGIRPGFVHLMIHSGSRKLGNVTGLYYAAKVAPLVMKKAGCEAALGCLPLDSPEGRRYLGAMTAAANWAFANRALMAERLKWAFKEELGRRVDFRLIYDVAHNIAKFERHEIGDRALEVLVHRKGATRAFPPGAPGLRGILAETGQPAIIPGSMGTRSWVVRCVPERIGETFGSVNHGSGRVMSRTAAAGGRKRKGKGAGRGGAVSREEFERATAGRGILVASGSHSDLRDEAPQVYKDSEEVIRVLTGAGLARPVAALRPLAVLKG
ncbi:MAG: RtcB family protein [Bacteroidota bacterium]